MEKNKKKNKVWERIVYFFIPAFIVFIFIRKLDKLEDFFGNYPHAVNGTSSILAIIATTASAIIAYKSYKYNVEREIRHEEKKSKSLMRKINRQTRSMRADINLVNFEHDTGIKVEKFLFENMVNKDTQETIYNYKSLVEKEFNDNITDFTEEDEKFISDRLLILDNLHNIIGVYIKQVEDQSSSGDQSNDDVENLKQYIQKRINIVKNSFIDNDKTD